MALIIFRATKPIIMKKILVTLIVFLSFFSVSSQTIVDMAGQRESSHYKNGEYYLKDVNNYLLPFLGTWRYVNGISEFRITVTKVSKYRVIFSDYKIDYYEDGVLLTYQKYENNDLVFSSPNTVTYPDGVIKEFGKLHVGFTDYQRDSVNFRLDLNLIALAPKRKRRKNLGPF